MEHQSSSLLSWVYSCQGKTMEELRHSLLYTNLELEQTRMLVQEELKKRDEQLMQVKGLLNKAMKERDEAQEKSQRLLLEMNLLLQQQGVSSHIEEEEQQTRRGNDSNNNGFSSSDCEESIVSSFDPPAKIPQAPQPPQCSSSPERVRLELGFPERPLPEKGKLLQAVMKVGPLLQTLLLAGPLPQWRHPPPQLESFEIPPVTIPSPTPSLQLLQEDSLVTGCGKVIRKRVLYEGSNSPRETSISRLFSIDC